MDNCPTCDSPEVIEVIKKQEVPYGYPNTVSLWVKVPVFVCTKCNYQWTDYRAEYIRQQAVNSAKGGL